MFLGKIQYFIIPDTYLNITAACWCLVCIIASSHVRSMIYFPHLFKRLLVSWFPIDSKSNPYATSV